MMKSSVWLSLMVSAILTGCSTQTAKPDGAAATDSDTAPSTSAALETPMQLPPVSTKRLVLHMTGPAVVVQAKDWPAFQEEWRATFADHAKEASIAFDVQKGDARPSGDDGTLVNVVVNDYRMVGIGSRIFFGVMTGNAYIDAKATYSSLNDGKHFGERSYNTSSTAWAGVFAKMTPQQVDAIATQVFAELGVVPPK